jgi:hypothetical protein
MHLFGGFFQLGYVTQELDAACDAFRTRFADIEFQKIDPQPLEDGVVPPTKRIALAYIDDVMVELIEPNSEQKTIYDEHIPAEPGAIKLHHLGYLIDDYAETLGQLQAAGHPVPLHGSFGDALDYIYADTRPELGHYTEFIRLGDAGRAHFDSLPRLRTR